MTILKLVGICTWTPVQCSCPSVSAVFNRQADTSQIREVYMHDAGREPDTCFAVFLDPNKGRLGGRLKDVMTVRLPSGIDGCLVHRDSLQWGIFPIHVLPDEDFLSWVCCR